MNSDISTIKSVGAKRAKLFNRLGIFTVYDMLTFYPRDYEDRSKIKSIMNIKDGESVCIKAYPFSTLKNQHIRRGLDIQRVTVSDLTGNVFISWFNQSWLIKSFDVSAEYIFYGKVSIKNDRLEMRNPVFERCENGKFTNRIVPIYPLTASLTQKVFQIAMENCMQYVGQIPEQLPDYLREKYTLCGIDYAISNIHFPEDFEKFNFARKRLVFEELLYLQLGLKLLKQRRVKLQSTSLYDNISDEFIKKLPFQLTNAQKRVVSEIVEDFKKTSPMNRLTQGDVGSGKTIVAAISMLIAVRNGKQAAMMAPTEILAMQHYETFISILANENIKIELLTGSQTPKQKNEIYEKISNGSVDIVIGTHALIQKNVEFKNLALVITDEQHRFGVKARAALATKGNVPHMLVMTATPIPRTLALILYGELDISTIDELPPGRKKVDTFTVGEDMRTRINSFMLKQIKEGRQIYIVCPLVEDSENSSLKSVTSFAEDLKQNIFKNHRVGLIYGKAKQKDKDEIMRLFANGEIDVLVSTTVIEVGVNVPNASVMVVENAERFGLSQLHQLRGRVGRGQWKSYCILYKQLESEITNKRMQIMVETNDGFVISQKDLEIRGPGEFFGVRQHGLPEFKIANIYTDMDIVMQAGIAANEIVKQDAYLKSVENDGLRQAITKMFGETDIFEFN